MRKMRQFIVSFHDFHGSQVDGTEHNPVLPTRFDIHLKRRLAIQFDGDIHHIASLIQTIGRCVRPSTCQVDTHRASAPYNLVGIHIQTRLLLLCQCRFGQPFAHQPESLALVIVVRFSLELHDTGTEHLIADTCHHRHGFRQSSRQIQTVTRILTGCVLQVQLIEHAMFVIPGQRFPIRHPECLPLGSQTAQVRPSRNFIRRHFRATQPRLLPFLQRRFSNHPT